MTINLGGTSRQNYRLGVPRAGAWELLLNSDDKVYEGAGNDLPHTVYTSPEAWDGQDQLVELHIPAMSVQYYVFKG